MSLSIPQYSNHDHTLAELPERYRRISYDSIAFGLSPRDLQTPIMKESISSKSTSSMMRRSIVEKNGLDTKEIEELEKQSIKLQSKIAKLARGENQQNSFALSSPSSSDKMNSSPPTISSNPLQKLDVLSWYKSWKNKKREVKVQAIYQKLIPRLQDTWDKLRQWLDEVTEEKKLAVSNAIKLYQEMVVAVEVCQSHIDMYDEIFNDCFQIGVDLKREIVDLKVALEFGKEIMQNGTLKRVNSSDEKKASEICHNHPYLGPHHLLHHRTHKFSHHRPRDIPTTCAQKVSDSENDTVIRLPAAEPAVWHGYHGPEGKNIHIAKSAGIASLVTAKFSADLQSTLLSLKPPSELDSRINLPVSLPTSRSITESSRSTPRRSSSPGPMKPKSVFLGSIFSSNQQSNRSHDDKSASSPESPPIDSSPKPFSISSLMRRRSLGSNADHVNCSALPASASSCKVSSSLRGSNPSCSPSTNRSSSLAISSSTSSLNSLLMEFNTSACTIELDNLFQESAQLLETSNDSTIEEIVHRMKQLKEVKESIGQFIQEVKQAREQAMKSKKTCKQIRDDLEKLIRSKNILLTLSDAAASDVESRTTRADTITPSSSPESLGIMAMSMTHQQPELSSLVHREGVAMIKSRLICFSSLMEMSTTTNANTSSYASSSMISDLSAGSPRSPCTSDGRLSPHHQHEISSVDEHPIRHPMKIDQRRLSIDSYSSSYDTDMSRRSSYDSKVDPLLSSSPEKKTTEANLCIDELKVSIMTTLLFMVTNQNIL